MRGNMQKYLPITQDTKLRSYTYDAYLEAVIGNPYRAGEIAAICQIDEFQEKDWTFEGENLTFQHKNERLFFKTSRFRTGMNGVLQREFGDTDQISLSIPYQQYSQPWGCVNVFIIPFAKEISESNAMVSVQRQNKNDNCNINVQGEQTALRWNKNEQLVIKRRENEIEISLFQKNHEDISFTRKYEIDDNYKKIKLQVVLQISLYNNIYYDWLYENHIQWKYSKYRQDVMFEFETSFKRNWNYYVLNYFVDYKVESIRFLRALHVDIMEFLKLSIQNENYVELWLDGYDLENTVMFENTHFIHQAMLYGFNDAENKFAVLCVNRGKPFLSHITYDNLNSQLSHTANDSIVTQKYNPEYVVLDCTTELCANSLQKYLEGKPVIDCEFLLPNEASYYGMEVYQQLKQGDGLQILLEDKRITRIICEHKELMKERVEYLVERKYFREEEVHDIIDKLEEIYQYAYELQGLQLKYMLGKKERLIPKIVTLLEKIEDLEKNIYPELLDKLRERNYYIT